MRKLVLFTISIIFSSSCLAKINLSLTVNCTYQKGQLLTNEKSENVTNSKPLNWTFNSLMTDKSIFVSGGDTGSVLSIPIEDGVIIFLPFATGTSTFTIWESGESFWGKQASLSGTYSQQFIGSCQN